MSLNAHGYFPAVRSPVIGSKARQYEINGRVKPMADAIRVGSGLTRMWMSRIRAAG